MNRKDLSLSEYNRAVDAIMLETFGIDTGDFEIEFYELARARGAGITPEDFVLNHCEQYGLTPLNEFSAIWGRS